MVFTSQHKQNARNKYRLLSLIVLRLVSYPLHSIIIEIAQTASLTALYNLYYTTTLQLNESMIHNKRHLQFTGLNITCKWHILVTHADRTSIDLFAGEFMFLGRNIMFATEYIN